MCVLPKTKYICTSICHMLKVHKSREFGADHCVANTVKKMYDYNYSLARSCGQYIFMCFPENELIEQR